MYAFGLGWPIFRVSDDFQYDFFRIAVIWYQFIHYVSCVCSGEHRFGGFCDSSVTDVRSQLQRSSRIPSFYASAYPHIYVYPQAAILLSGTAAFSCGNIFKFSGCGRLPFLYLLTCRFQKSNTKSV